MSKNFYTNVQISPKLAALHDNVQGRLVKKVIPKAIAKAVPLVRQAILSKLPDGQTGDNTRSKQSAKSRRRFPTHMKDHVGVKKLNNQRVAMSIVGVTSKAKHVNFDHGDKAKTVGRVHKLWWIDGKHEVFHTPKLRKQHRDIPKLVQAEVGDRVLSIIEAELTNASKNGGLTK